MTEKSIAREVIIAVGLGFLTNILWTAITSRFDIYITTTIFIAVAVVYLILWVFIIKPLVVSHKVKIKNVYQNYEIAKPSLHIALKESSNIKIMSVGGSSITEEDRGEVLNILTRRVLAGASVRILLLNPNSTAINSRFKELQQMKPQNGQPSDLSNHITNSANKIITRDSRLSVRYYDTTPVWRLVLMDKVAYVSFYLGDKEGQETSMIILDRGTDLFSAIERQFDALWETGKQSSSISTP
jgi:hypothetical protein